MRTGRNGPFTRPCNTPRGGRSFFIERPVRLPTLGSAVASVLQSRKRQYEIRDYLEERARNEQRYRALFTSIDEGFCVIDVLFDGNGVACDYRFIEANPAFEKQAGLVGAIGKTIRELVPEHERIGSKSTAASR